MTFTPDRFLSWHSGLVECPNNVLFDLDKHRHPVTLKFFIDNLNEYHQQVHPNESFELHILACRVNLRKKSNNPKTINVNYKTIDGEFSHLFSSINLKSNDDDNNMDISGGTYKSKYLKYKKKYLDLKNNIKKLN